MTHSEQDKAELIDFEWKGVAVYTTKYFSAEAVEEVTIAEVQEDVHHAAPEQNQGWAKFLLFLTFSDISFFTAEKRYSNFR